MYPFLLAVGSPKVTTLAAIAGIRLNCGCSSVVEHLVANENVACSSHVTRLNFNPLQVLTQNLVSALLVLTKKNSCTK